MNILLTGITGFIGKHLAQSLLDAGHSVSGIVRAASNTDGLSHYYNLYQYDGSYESVSAAFIKSRPDVVIHLATRYVASHNACDIEPLVDSNVLFGTFLLEAMKNNDCNSMINVGTRWQHQDDKAYAAVNLYAATKQAFLAIIEYYVSAFDLKCLTLELSDTYGPDDTRGKIVDLLASALKDNKKLDLSPGEQLLDLIYIDDVCDATINSINIIKRISKGTVKTYTVSSGEPISLREIGSIAESIFENSNLLKWGAKSYREREAMKPYIYFPLLPDWSPANNSNVRLAGYFRYLKTKSNSKELSE